MTLASYWEATHILQGVRKKSHTWEGIVKSLAVAVNTENGFRGRTETKWRLGRTTRSGRSAFVSPGVLHATVS